MTDKIYIVEGRQFRHEIDYKKALRDETLIHQLRGKYDFQSKTSLETLRAELEEGTKYPFYTILGMDFMEEVEEALVKVKDAPGGTKRQSGGKSAVVFSGKKTTQKAPVHKYDEKEMAVIVKEELARRERNRKRFLLACTVMGAVCLISFGGYAYEGYRTRQNYDAYVKMKEKSQALPMDVPVESEVQIHYTGEQEAPEILDEYKNLFNMNKRLIGWLKIDDTIIDYPVMQTVDNEYYLNHNINQEKDRNGALFMDAGCDVVKGNTNYIIYGHNMLNGQMFGDLDKYKKEDYYKEHKKIIFDTIYEKGEYEVMFAFNSQVLSEEDVSFKYYQFIDALSEYEFNSYMAEMKSWSFYDTGVTATFGDELLTLSTCDKSVMENGRFVVVAKRIK